VVCSRSMCVVVEVEGTTRRMGGQVRWCVRGCACAAGSLWWL
jgi:hypothetical protein